MNRLAGEKSPYLLQHAQNPVDWHPWGEEAFEAARREDKPIFLSIGYSTCHWCHVMERESFEDREVAKALNESFLSVKVDREERPDLDQYYMAVCQMLAGSGGWPLTIVMTPDKRPFFAGTYFPKSKRWGRQGLLDLLPQIAEAWRARREEVVRSADDVVAAVGRSRLKGPAETGNSLSAATLDEAFRELAADFDEARGGFGGAPKFPIPHHIGFLLRYWRRTGRGEALAMAGKTLKCMRRGGIYDHLGGGFHRYSTDADWLVPHFEKMLYDQALLAEVYAEAFAATGRGEFKRTAAAVADYVLRDLALPEGGLASAEDADSEGQEGKFYLWTADELGAVLDPAEAEFATGVFNVSPAGNFAEPGRARDGRNVLHRGGTPEGQAADGRPAGDAPDARIVEIRQKLAAAREHRARPFRDNKVLADWNGLMVAALASVFRITGEARYLSAAERAADFVLERMRAPDGRLLHMFAEGEARVPAFLDDHAFLAKGLVALYEAGFDPGRLEQALELVGQAIELFWDAEHGGFFFTAAPEAGDRRKEIYDGAVPSGNSVMLMNLVRLARLTGRKDLEERASWLAETFRAEIGDQPRLYTEFLKGLDHALGPSKEVVIVGRTDEADARELLGALGGAYLPNAVFIFKPVDKPEAARTLERLAAFTKDMVEVKGKAAAYVCSGGTCRRPITSAAGLLDSLRSR